MRPGFRRCLRRLALAAVFGAVVAGVVALAADAPAAAAAAAEIPAATAAEVGTADPGGPASGSLGDALAGGRADVDLRYRFERVDQGGFEDEAEASTIRLRLGYETGTWRGLFALAEVEAVEPVGDDRYNSTANGRTRFPVVADPENTEVNQALLGWKPIDEVALRLGRQRIELDNQRFVGGVAWRQNEQTYDALTARGEIGERLSYFYGHLENANRVFGEDHPNPSLADLDLAADLLNVGYRFDPGTLVAYAYLLDLEDAPAASHRNLGLRFTGRHALGDGLALVYAGEIADQSDYEEGDAAVDATYHLAEIGAAWKDLKELTVKLGHERLGGDGAYALQTPLATLHSFNGWADVFLVTPPQGLEDLYVYAGARVSGCELQLVYHDFEADRRGLSYGDEWDALVGRTFREKYGVQLKYANFTPDRPGAIADVDKLWITLLLKFSATAKREG